MMISTYFDDVFYFMTESFKQTSPIVSTAIAGKVIFLVL